MQVRRRDVGRGMEDDFVGPGVLLDKYREKQRHGGSNENENKGALRNYGLVCSGDDVETEETEIRFRRILRTKLS